MKTYLINKNGTQDISELITRITWSGDIMQVARKLELSIIISPNDYYLPKVYIGLGNMLLLLTDEGEEIFRGYVFFKEKSHQSDDLRVVAYDGLIYLTKSKGSYNFKNTKAQEITKRVCKDLGIECNNIASSNIPINLIVLNNTGYETIMKAYTEVSKQNGKKYLPIMKENLLNIIEKGAYIVPRSLVLSNSTYSENIENMINRVIITDDKGNKLNEVSDEKLMQDYGLIQGIYQKEENKDPLTIAKSLLHGSDRNASIEAFGDSKCISGNAVKVQDRYTELIGLFYIDNDTHTWENGQHTMSLGLNFKNMMDEKEG